jgi:hypothetical protein
MNKMTWDVSYFMKIFQIVLDENHNQHSKKNIYLLTLNPSQENESCSLDPSIHNTIMISSDFAGVLSTCIENRWFTSKYINELYNLFDLDEDIRYHQSFQEEMNRWVPFVQKYENIDTYDNELALFIVLDYFIQWLHKYFHHNKTGLNIQCFDKPIYVID